MYMKKKELININIIVINYLYLGYLIFFIKVMSCPHELMFILV